jgi:hypothetical protein
MKVWRMYADNPILGRKLNNYQFLRGNLVVKAVVNATPFSYGQALAAYHPFTNFTGERTRPINTTGALDALCRSALSQRPHAVMSLNTNQGFTMKLPFVNKKQAIRITNARDWDEMGHLDLVDIVPHYRASNKTNPASVSITIYAWMEDVELYGATSRDVLAEDVEPQCFSIRRRKRRVLVKNWQRATMATVSALIGETPSTTAEELSEFLPQSGISAKDVVSGVTAIAGTLDEYGTAPVSSTASAVAVAAGWVADRVPKLKPYMKATETAAEWTSTIASAFGYSDPVVLSNVMPVKNSPFHSLASPEICDPMSRLTLDPKNELSIDSRTVGLDGTDELAVASLVTRPTIIATKAWQTTDGRNDLLVDISCEPDVKNTDGGDPSYDTIQRTPFGHVAQLFRWWRGDVEIDIEVVASPYHSGRLKVVWESEDSTDVIEATHFTKVIDIASDRRVKITVPWLQDTLWKRCRNGIGAFDYFTTNGTELSYDRVYRNGTLRILVETALSTPDGGDGAVLLIRYNGASNVAFADPTAPYKWSSRANHNSDFYQPQSGSKPLEDGVSTDAVETAMADPADAIDAIGLVTMGEAVLSLRPLMRRMVHYYRECFRTENTSGYNVHNFTFPRQPVFPGYQYGGFTPVDSSTRRYNFVNWTASTWMRMCFLGERGSHRYKVNTGDEVATYDLALLRSRDQLSTDYRFDYQIRDGQWDSSYDWFVNHTSSGIEGMALTNQLTQAALAAEVPMYNKYRMISTLKSNLGSTEDDTLDDGITIRTTMLNENTPKTRILDIYTGVGVDYALFFFVNVPPVYHLKVQPNLGE